MTFSAIPGEFEEVCQRHDAFVEQGRLELIAEQGTDHDAGRVAFAIERSLQELAAVDAIDA